MALEIRDFEVVDQAGVRLLGPLELRLEAGMRVGLVGESGSGKTLLVHALFGVLPTGVKQTGGQGGRLVLPSPLGRRFGWVPQEPLQALHPLLRVKDLLGLLPLAHLGEPRPLALGRLLPLLDRLGLPTGQEFLHRFPHQLSGGQRQRLSLAMALSCDPDYLVLDEPTTALDVTIQAQILELMQELQKRTGSAIILITHDLGVVADMADNVLVMYAGRPVEYGSVDEVFYQPLHPYTWGLMDSLPEYAVDEKSTLCPIKGQPPSLINVPSGCAFHPRCPFAQPKCKTDEPKYRMVEGGHGAACHFAGDPGFTRTEACAVPVPSDTGLPATEAVAS